MTQPQRFARAGRRTNLALGWLLIGCAASGLLAFAAGHGVAAVLAAGLHGSLASAVIVLAPWKNAVVQRVRRLRRLRPTGLVLLALVVLCLSSGFVELFAGYVVVLGVSPIQVHVGSVLALGPVLGWHVLTHRRQRLRRADLGRRTLLTSAAGLAGSAAGVAALTGAAQLTGGPRRRPVGTGSRLVADAPATIWLFDRVPVLADDHPVRLPGRTITAAELRVLARPVRARLDCTSGWYAEQTWSGVPLSDLLGQRVGRTVALVVRSATGYVRVFPADDADRLWLAVASDGVALDDLHGGPVRLVAPGRRGFWWVKWVETIELSDRPSWLQPPFPLQ